MCVCDWGTGHDQDGVYTNSFLHYVGSAVNMQKRLFINNLSPNYHDRNYRRRIRLSGRCHYLDWLCLDSPFRFTINVHFSVESTPNSVRYAGVIYIIEISGTV